MASTTVRLAETTRVMLRELAQRSGEPMSVVLEKAVECYRRQCILEAANAAYAALRADPEAWREELREREAWETTLTDDVADDPEAMA